MSADTQISPETPINLDQLLERCLGNIDFAQRIIAKFENSFDKELRELERCVNDRDGEGAAMMAHRMKGASANVSADDLRGALEKIESHARARRLDEITQCWRELDSAWRRFKQYTANVRSQRGASAT